MQKEYTLSRSEIARGKSHINVARVATLTKVAKRSPKKHNRINKRLSYTPVCWICGAERGLLKIHASGVLYVCRACGGEQ